MADPIKSYNLVKENEQAKSIAIDNLDALSRAVAAVGLQENKEESLPQLQMIAERKNVNLPADAFRSVDLLEDKIREARTQLESDAEVAEMRRALSGKAED